MLQLSSSSKGLGISCFLLSCPYCDGLSPLSIKQEKKGCVRIGTVDSAMASDTYGVRGGGLLLGRLVGACS